MISFITVKKYCSEDISLIENYEEALISNEPYDCHHRLEIQDGKPVSVKYLKEQGLYYNRPATELIFLSHKIHMSMHSKISSHPAHIPWNKGFTYFNNGNIEIQSKECPKGFVKGRLPRSEEWSGKISKSRSNNPIPQTEELRRKLRESHLGYKHSNETKQKISEISKGRQWYNNGTINRFEKYQPKGFVKGKLPHHK